MKYILILFLLIPLQTLSQESKVTQEVFNRDTFLEILDDVELDFENITGDKKEERKYWDSYHTEIAISNEAVNEVRKYKDSTLSYVTIFSFDVVSEGFKKYGQIREFLQKELSEREWRVEEFGRFDYAVSSYKDPLFVKTYLDNARNEDGKFQVFLILRKK